jgi:hypothetical protein
MHMLAVNRWLYSYSISEDLYILVGHWKRALSFCIELDSVFCAINYRIATAARWLVVGLLYV